jgi:hypothetical protein
VPSHWLLHGHGAPAYTNVAYPFPVDPPQVPDEKPTGDHRRTFRVPAAWRGTAAVLRFDGVDSCFRAWLNGVELRTATGSRLPAEFDVGALLRPGEENVLALRVHRWSAGSYGLRIEGRPHFELSARRWTSEELDAARHTTDLVARDRIFVNADLAQHGIGSASCGPGVLPAYRLEARPAAYAVVLRAVGDEPAQPEPGA